MTVSAARRGMVVAPHGDAAETGAMMLREGGNATEGIGLKIAKNGGLTKGRRQCNICVAAGYTMSVQDTTGSDAAFAAIVHARNPERSIMVGGRTTIFTPAYGSPHMLDLDNVRRSGTIADFVNFAKLAYLSPAVHMTGGVLCEPMDVPVSKPHLHTPLHTKQRR